MSKRILELEKNTWIQAYQIRNFELGVLQKKTPWILSKHINCYYDPKAMGIFNHCIPRFLTILIVKTVGTDTKEGLNTGLTVKENLLII